MRRWDGKRRGAEAQRRRERRGMGEKSAAPQAHPAGEHFQVRHGSVTLRPLRLCASALKILIPLRGLELQRGILPRHRRSRSRAARRLCRGAARAVDDFSDQHARRRDLVRATGGPPASGVRRPRRAAGLLGKSRARSRTPRRRRAHPGGTSPAPASAATA